MLNAHHDVRLRGWRKIGLICRKPALQGFTARLSRLRDVDGESRNAIDPFHQLKHCNAFNDYGKGRGNSTFDDAVDLIVEMNDVILRRNQEQIGLDQGYIEVPRKKPPKRGFSDTVATIDRDDHTR